jgi:hypothetical protein
MLNVAYVIVFDVLCLNCRAENEKMTIKMQTDDLKSAHDRLNGEKVGKKERKIGISCSFGEVRGNFRRML